MKKDLNFKCPACGSALDLDFQSKLAPDITNLRCPNCQKAKKPAAYHTTKDGKIMPGMSIIIE